MLFQNMPVRFPTGDHFTDFLVTACVIAPNITAIILGVLTLLNSRENTKKLTGVERTLNGKVDKSAEREEKVEASDN